MLIPKIAISVPKPSAIFIQNSTVTASGAVAKNESPSAQINDPSPSPLPVSVGPPKVCPYPIFASVCDVILSASCVLFPVPPAVP